MNALQAVQDVRYVTVKGKRFAVIDADEWEELIERIEDLEDIQVFKEAMSKLDAAGGDLVVAKLHEAEALDHGSMVASKYVGAMPEVDPPAGQRDTPDNSAQSIPAARAPAMSVSS